MKHNPYWITVIVLLFVLLVPATLNAQTANVRPITYGSYRKIHSAVLGEDRTLLIRLPEGYEKSGKQYPVLYKLDGYKNVFLETSSAVDYLVDLTDKAPDHIVVAVENTDRMRDMSPEQSANKFIQFLKSELVPFIGKNYRTDGFNIIAGQSLSSIFAFYSFLKEPDLFDAYIFSSFGLPTPGMTSAFYQGLKNPSLKSAGRRYLFIANGKIDQNDPDGSITKAGAQFLESLRSVVPGTVVVKSVTYESEGHVPFPTIYDGLKWIYSQQRASREVNASRSSMP